MATLLERAGSRSMAIESLLPQVDRLVVVPGDERGPTAKFEPCRHLPDDAVFFGVDDDLVYPADYVAHTLGWLDRYPETIVAHHGFTIDSEGNRRLTWRCLEAQDEPADVHVVGSGVCAFRISTIRPLVPDHFPDPAGVEPGFAVLAERLGVRRVAIPHPGRWFGYFEARKTMWTETAAETGSLFDASAAMSEGCRQLSEMIDDLPEPEPADELDEVAA